jgi:hypothetical protein
MTRIAIAWPDRVEGPAIVGKSVSWRLCQSSRVVGAEG